MATFWRTRSPPSASRAGPRESLNDDLVGVEHHVHGERDPGGLADRADVVVEGVAVGD
jgi:hypothetical protein